MAGDWIKVEKETPGKPELRHVARLCGVSTGEAFYAWFRLWCYFDSQTEEGFIPFLTAQDADAEAGISGFGEALQKADWLTFHKDGCTIKNWHRHNGKSAKKRSLTARRVADCRSK